MDLTAIRGVGPAYRDRLEQAGIQDVAALARVPDLSSLSEWTGIPSARLAALQAEALRVLDRTPAEDDAGIVLDSPPRGERFGARVRAGVAEVPLALRKAGIRVVAFAGALGATLRPSRGKSA
jgi:nucleotidyltransferase/DNA polymerase involved in DNA repair